MFYAVVRGRKSGVYNSWSECENNVKGFKGAHFQKFKTEADAIDFVKNAGSSKPSKVATQSKISKFFKITPSSNKKNTPRLIVDKIPVAKNQNKTSGISKRNKPSAIKYDVAYDYYVYTDGACSHNGRKNAKAGIGIYFGDNDTRNISERVIGRQTNNTAELTAIIKTYDIIKTDLKNGKKVCIASDSQYSIWCATTYGKRMAKDNWRKDIPNKKLVQEIYELYGNNPNVSFRHVRAHTSNTDIHSIGNDHADRLANEAIGLSNCPYQ